MPQPESPRPHVQTHPPILAGRQDCICNPFSTKKARKVWDFIDNPSCCQPSALQYGDGDTFGSLQEIVIRKMGVALGAAGMAMAE